MANVTYDREGDVLIIELVAGADGPEAQGPRRCRRAVMLLYGGDNRLIGIEIMAASKTLVPGALDNLPAVA